MYITNMPIYSISIVLYVASHLGRTGKAGVYALADYTLHV